MRTTVDLPDALFRRAKAEAALRGFRLKDLIEEGLRMVLGETDIPRGGPTKPPATLHDAMQEVCGIADGPSDYSTNPDYLDEFGR